MCWRVRPSLGIKPLISDKTMFRTWNEKFVNALAQAIPGSRECMDDIVKKINQKRKDELNEDEWDFVYVDRRCWSEFNENLWCILLDKCEGGALTRVRVANQGMGIKAYVPV